MMLDLDDTLIDRSAAFRAGVTDLFARYRLPPEDIEWVMDLDGGGYTAREAVSAAMIDRYGLALPVDELVDLLRRGAVEHVRLAPETRDAIQRAGRAGWHTVIVTNGATGQQEAKIRATGLDHLVGGWVISEAVGVAKPDPAIFHAAAAVVGQSLREAWMIGDNAEKDIGGAADLGLTTVWLDHGRRWPLAAVRPSYVAATPERAIGYAMAAGRMGA